MGWNYDPDAIHSHQSGEINALTEKTTPHADDLLLGEDSENSGAKVGIKVGNLGGGAEVLDDLTDVDTTGVADGDVLVYDADTSTWVPGEGGGSSNASYSEKVGDASETTFEVEHSLDSSAVVVEVIEVSSGDGLVAGTDYTWSVVDDDKIQVVFDTAPGADDALVVVVASGGTSGGGGGGGVFEGVMWDGGSLRLYTVPGLTLTAKGSANVGTIRKYVPVFWAEPVHVDNLVAEVTGGASAGRAMRVGLYEATFYGMPGALIAEGEIDASSTGVKTVAVDQTLPPGRYLLCFQSNTSSAGFRFHRVGPSNQVLLGTNNWARPSVSVAYGPLDDPGVPWDTVDSTSNQDFTAVYLEISPVP